MTPELEASDAQYEWCTGTDGDLLLVARDPHADWFVVATDASGAVVVCPRMPAEGEIAHYLGLLGHPSWNVPRRREGAVHIFTGDGSFPIVIERGDKSDARSPARGSAKDDGIGLTFHRSITEAASWRLATELCRRHPDRLRIFELHPGGGQYDCLTIADHQSEALLIHLNRVGTIQVHARADDRPVGDIPTWRWQEYLTADPYDFLREVEEAAGLQPPSTMPSTDSRTLVYRVLASVAAAAVLGRGRREILNGYFDSSSEGCAPREKLFERFPGASTSRRDESLERWHGVAEYRFWFVVDDGEPVVCLDEAGRAWDRDGAVIDLLADYERVGRDLGRLLGALFPKLLT